MELVKTVGPTGIDSQVSGEFVPVTISYDVSAKTVITSSSIIFTGTTEIPQALGVLEKHFTGTTSPLFQDQLDYSPFSSASNIEYTLREVFRADPEDETATKKNNDYLNTIYLETTLNGTKITYTFLKKLS